MSKASHSITPFREGLAQLCMGRSTYHVRVKTDPDLPRTIPLGDAPNSPAAFITEELDAYIARLIEAGRARRDATADARAGRAKKMVAARTRTTTR